MFAFVIGLIFIIVAALVFIVAAFTKTDEDFNSTNKMGTLAGSAVFGIVGLVILAFSMVIIIPENAVGVKVVFGKAQVDTFDTGVNFKAPWVGVETFSYQTEIFEAPELDSSSQDLQQVTSTVEVNWHINPDQAVTIYRNFRQGLSTRVLVPSIAESVKATTASYPADELIGKRTEVREAFKATLKQKLTNFDTCLDCIRIVEVNLGNFDFSEVFDEAIESKQKAEQLALEQQNVTLQKEEEAKQIEAIAKGEAQAAIARAQAEKQKRILEAEGLAEAIKLQAEAEAEAILAVKNAEADGNALISESATEDAIKWQISKALENGTFQTIVLPTGSEFILGSEVLGK